MAWQLAAGLAACALHCLLGASALHTDYATEALQSIWKPEDDGPLIQSPVVHHQVPEVHEGKSREETNQGPGKQEGADREAPAAAKLFERQPGGKGAKKGKKKLKSDVVLDPLEFEVPPHPPTTRENVWKQFDKLFAEKLQPELGVSVMDTRKQGGYQKDSVHTAGR